jgi:hypothetical protein
MKIMIAIAVFVLTFAIVAGTFALFMLPSLWDHGGPDHWANLLSNVFIGFALLFSLWAASASYRYLKSSEVHDPKAAP